MSNKKSNVAAKHIDVKYHVVKDRIQDQTINVKHISTTNMLADPLTKGLPPSIFRACGRHGFTGSLWILELWDNLRFDCISLVCCNTLLCYIIPMDNGPKVEPNDQGGECWY